MAIQNNLKATFYGKLGDMVGMRWKNITTLRRYVVPNNPRTPRQQENRALFKQATHLAQQALSINYKAPCWDSVSRTEFQLRTGVARRRIAGGVTGFSLIPLFPNGYSPAHELTDLGASGITSHSAFTVRSSSFASLNQTRQIWVGILAVEVGKSDEELFFTINTCIAGSDLLLQGLPTEIDLSKSIEVAAISVDDRSFNDEMVYAPMQSPRF